MKLPALGGLVVCTTNRLSASLSAAAGGGPQAQHGVGTVSLTNSSPTYNRNDGNGLLGYLESTTAVSCRIAMPTGMESTLDPVLLLASVAVEFSVMINC